ncbi:MAG: PAS domain-containing protein [Candidatus Hinthialibacter antarcticus]|nr:PAS domain-containing protein [Candidatus Hinthialibacter antarcticus]
MFEFLSFKDKNLYVIRVVALVFSILFLFTGSVFFYFIPQYSQSLLDAKYELIREMVNTQISLIERHDQLAQDGEMSLEEAKRHVIDIIRDVRYGAEGKDYFWISDFQPVMIMHPYRTDFEGDDLAELFDADGNPLLYTFVKIAETKNEGFLQYPWQRYEDDNRIIPKLSFIKAYTPWGWIVGTGIYIDDVNAKIAATEHNLIIFFCIVFLCVAVLSWVLVAQGFQQDKMRSRAVLALQESKQRLKDILEFLPDATFVIDTNQQVIAWNRAMVELTGVKKEEMLGKGDYEYALPFYGERRKVLCDLLLQPDPDNTIPYDAVIRDANSIAADAFTPNLGAEGKHLHATASLLFGIDGEVVGAIETLRDISDRISAQETITNQYKLFVTLLDAIPLPVFYKNSDEKYIGCNRAYEKMIGKRFEDIAGRTTQEVWPEALARDYAEQDRQLLEHSGIQQFQTKAVRADGASREVICYKAVFHDSEGNIAGIIGVIQDITDEILIKTSLQESEAKLRAIFNQSFQFMAVVSTSGVVVAINQTALDFAGAKENEIVGHHFADTPYWKNSPDRARCIEAIQKASNGEMVRFQKTHPDLDNNIHHIDFSIKPFYNDDGSIPYLIAEGRDVSEYVALEEQFRQTQKMEAIGTLAGGIAHDFNNMLFAIQGYNELAYIDSPEDGNVRQRLDQSQKAIVRAQELVKQILAFSRKVENERKPIDLSKDIYEIFQLIRAPLPTTIQVDINLPDHSVYVLADPTQLHQVLMNLCTNAAHALREQGSQLTITLEEEIITGTPGARLQELTPGRYAKIQVSDDGVGIPPDIAERIFEPFFTTKPEGEGTGLGLSVVHGIIKSHQGCIFVDSKLQEGATFSIYLPQIVQPLPESENKKIIVQRSSQKGSILYVDDDKEIVEINHQRLSRAGYSFKGVTDSAEALALIQSSLSEFDLIITDQTMPNLTGIQLAKEAIAIQSDFPVILCSGYTDSSVMEQLAVVGVRKFLTKPISNDELIDAIEDILS